MSKNQMTDLHKTIEAIKEQSEYLHIRGLPLEKFKTENVLKTAEFALEAIEVIKRYRVCDDVGCSCGFCLFLTKHGIGVGE